jgi:predicted metalloprotease with PDZ domain
MWPIGFCPRWRHITGLSLGVFADPHPAKCVVFLNKMVKQGGTGMEQHNSKQNPCQNSVGYTRRVFLKFW